MAQVIPKGLVVLEAYYNWLYGIEFMAAANIMSVGSGYYKNLSVCCVNTLWN